MPQKRLFSSVKIGAASIDDEATNIATKTASQQIIKFSKHRTLLVAAVVMATSIGAAFAYHNLQSEVVPTSIVGSDTSTARDLNPNGAEIVVRAFTVRAGWGASRAKHAFTGSLQPRYQAAVAFRV